MYILYILLILGISYIIYFPGGIWSQINNDISFIMRYRLLGISSQINNDISFIMTYRLLGISSQINNDLI